MSVLAILLLAVGTADALRARCWGEPGRARAVACLGGLVMLVVAGAGTGLATGADAALLAVAALVAVGWVLTSDEQAVRARGAATPLLVLAGGSAVLVGLSGWGSPAAGALQQWLEWSEAFGAVDADRVLLLAGLLLAQVATGNVLVRLVLIGVGALKPQGTPQASDRLRGGRVLGPLERVLILGLGLAGEVTAASLVIAAKALIRWPELQQSRITGRSRTEGERADAGPGPGVRGPFDSPEPAPGIDEVTEYFLVGSMVSWLVALLALAVALLAGQ